MSVCVCVCATEEVLLHDTNKLLDSIGLGEKVISSQWELVTAASSMFVGIFESVFGCHLEEVCRQPANEDDYIQNAQLVLDGLKRMLPPSVQVPATITGRSLCSGDMPAIRFMVSMFTELDAIIKGAEISKPSTDGSVTPTSPPASAAGPATGAATAGSQGSAIDRRRGAGAGAGARKGGRKPATATAGSRKAQSGRGKAGGAVRVRSGAGARAAAVAGTGTGTSSSVGARPVTRRGTFTNATRRTAVTTTAAAATRRTTTRRTASGGHRMRALGDGAAHVRHIGAPGAGGAAGMEMFGAPSPAVGVEGRERPSTAPARRTAGLYGDSRLAHSSPSRARRARSQQAARRTVRGSSRGSRAASRGGGRASAGSGCSGGRAVSGRHSPDYQSDLWMSTTPDADTADEDGMVLAAAGVGAGAGAGAGVGAGAGASAASAARPSTAAAPAPAPATAPRHVSGKSTRFIREQRRTEPVVHFGGPVEDPDVMREHHRVAQAFGQLRKLQRQERRDQQARDDAIKRLKDAQRLALKDRAASLRRSYRCTVTNAQLRARAAQHERRVKVVRVTIFGFVFECTVVLSLLTPAPTLGFLVHTQIRTKCVMEDMERRQVSMRLKRASMQTALQAQLLKEAADHARLAFIDEQRFALEEAATKRRMAALNVDAARHTSRIRLQLIKEEAQESKSDREIMLRAQQLALKRMERELLGEGVSVSVAASVRCVCVSVCDCLRQVDPVLMLCL